MLNYQRVTAIDHFVGKFLREAKEICLQPPGLARLATSHAQLGGTLGISRLKSDT